MTIKKLLIANRGEIAVRIARAAAEMGIPSVAIYAVDDAASLHRQVADEAIALNGTGVSAYLDIDGVIAAAKAGACDAVHPGYGFLSENVDFARACADAGLKFVGPNPDALALFGDKTSARSLAERTGVPLLAGTKGATSLPEAKAFFESLGAGGAMMIKAVAGGGGRGMRPVTSAADIEEAYARCQSEAKSAFGNDAVYVEKLITRARHIEIQIVADGSTFIHLGERECTLQRQRQKLVEIAPSPTLSASLRETLCAAAVKLAREAKYDNIGTFEFLIDASDGAETTFAFMEANPRLQVEHTVTEEVTGVDLVKTQLRIAGGETLSEIGLAQTPDTRGHAVQLRINMESMGANGEALPSGGTLTAFQPPSGPGIRVDTFGYAGYATSPHYDSLLAKLIAYSPSASYDDVVARAARALSEFHIDGVKTNLSFHSNLLAREEFAANDFYTTFIADHAASLSEASNIKSRYATAAATSPKADAQVLTSGPAGTIPLPSHLQGRVVSIDLVEGDRVASGQQIAVLEAMKMEHVVTASAGGVVRKVCVQSDETVFEGSPLLFIEEMDVTASGEDNAADIDLDHVRPDLAEMIERHAIGLDERRPEAVERRRSRNQRTARENIADICDEGTFIEYGALALAAQRRRRSMEDLIKMSPADGMVTGVGAINGDRFGDEAARAMILSYDFTVFAGTQGAMNHKKTDRMLQLAHQWNLPLVLFGEGGGGRPGDTDSPGVAGLDNGLSTISCPYLLSRTACRFSTAPPLKRTSTSG